MGCDELLAKMWMDVPNACLVVDPVERAVLSDIHRRMNPRAVESDKRHVKVADEIGVVACAVTVGRLPKDSRVHGKPHAPAVLSVAFGLEPVAAEPGVRGIAADVESRNADEADENPSPRLAARD